MAENLKYNCKKGAGYALIAAATCFLITVLILIFYFTYPNEDESIFQPNRNFSFFVDGRLTEAVLLPVFALFLILRKGKLLLALSCVRVFVMVIVAVIFSVSSGLDGLFFVIAYRISLTVTDLAWISLPFLLYNTVRKRQIVRWLWVVPALIIVALVCEWVERCFRGFIIFNEYAIPVIVITPFEMIFFLFTGLWARSTIPENSDNTEPEATVGEPIENGIVRDDARGAGKL